MWALLRALLAKWALLKLLLKALGSLAWLVPVAFLIVWLLRWLFGNGSRHRGHDPATD
jgi:hypothetical protein